MANKRKSEPVFKEYNTTQLMLLPPSLDEFIDANHPVRLVNRVIDKINVAHPDALPADSLMQYAEKVRDGAKTADLHFIDIWWAGNLRKKNQYYPFIKATGMSGVSDWSGTQEVEYSPIDGTPVVHSFYYYPDLKQPEKFANELIKETQSVSAPWFLIIYGGTPRQFYNVAMRLPADKFKVVTLDEFYEAVRQARSQVEYGRSLQKLNRGDCNTISIIINPLSKIRR